MKNQSKTSTSKLINYFVRDSKVVFASTCFGLMITMICSAIPSINVSAASYSIIYDDNVTSNMPTDETNTTLNTSVNISSNTPTRDGYNFLKWCSQVPASDGTCGGTEYSPGGAWTISQTSTNNLKLYAMWKKEGKALYDKVSAMSKGTQTAADLQTAISTSNSGVYEYNSSVFGASSDAANDHKIYYYRGILDNTVGTYGSDGDNAAYPNTVVLSSASSKGSLTTSDTCWRIVRTTGSGGVKMVYQGKWTGSTCANSQTNAQVTTSAFDTTANSSGKSIVGVGYTYNATYKSTTSNTTAANLFSTNSTYTNNSTSSTIKTYIENTWFSNINSYASRLEPSAGYCNDRTIYNNNSYTAPLAESTNISTPYTTASSGITIYRFGAFARNRNSAQSPSLTCATYGSVNRSTVDLYTTSSASNGNKQLSKPAALLTADELSFAGSGSSTASEGSARHANSYLRSGSYFWLLSPYYRTSNGYAREFILYSDGYLNNDLVSAALGVRPAISLASGTEAAGGSGTATDPWIVNP